MEIFPAIQLFPLNLWLFFSIESWNQSSINNWSILAFAIVQKLHQLLAILIQRPCQKISLLLLKCFPFLPGLRKNCKKTKDSTTCTTLIKISYVQVVNTNQIRLSKIDTRKRYTWDWELIPDNAILKHLSCSQFFYGYPFSIWIP